MSISGEELAQKTKGTAGLPCHTDDKQEVPTSPATSLQRQESGNPGTMLKLPEKQHPVKKGTERLKERTRRDRAGQTGKGPAMNWAAR